MTKTPSQINNLTKRIFLKEAKPAGGHWTIHHQVQVSSSSEKTVPLGQRNGNWKKRPATTTHLEKRKFSRIDTGQGFSKKTAKIGLKTPTHYKYGCY